MISDTFISGGKTYRITVYPSPSNGSRYPIIILVHGNFGLVSPYGDQIQNFAKDLADRGYLTAVPQYYQDDEPQPTDTDPKDQILTDAISAVTNRPEADPNRIGLIGFSLGAATAMTFIASNPSGKVKVLADFFGFITPTIQGKVANFPPTTIFHNKHDKIVEIQNSKNLSNLLSSAKIEQQFIEYDEQWLEGNHAFEPNGPSDIDSRSKTIDWLTKYLPPTGL
jgi:carboxymethylenebutenolidase